MVCQVVGVLAPQETEYTAVMNRAWELHSGVAIPGDNVLSILRVIPR